VPGEVIRVTGTVPLDLIDLNVTLVTTNAPLAMGLASLRLDGRSAAASSPTYSGSHPERAQFFPRFLRLSTGG
jgi:hypothetical protein